MSKPYYDLMQVRQVVDKLPLVTNELFAAGLYATGQLMHEVVRKSGYEMAELLERSKDAKSE